MCHPSNTRVLKDRGAMQLKVSTVGEYKGRFLFSNEA